VTASDAGGDAEGEAAAVEALERLGLSNYEARVFVALQALGVGTAREVHEVAGVPRSQVYGAADALVERGLVERQQSTPKRYRPVALDAARERLTARLERERERAFEYLDTLAREERPAESREDVWSLHGREAVTERVVELVGRASERLLFGAASADLVTPELVEAVRARAAAGVDVTVVSADPAVRAAFSAPVRVCPGPTDGGHTGRVALCDDNVVLVSVRAAGGETAIWSADTALADVLVQTMHAGIADAVDGLEPAGAERDGRDGTDVADAGDDADGTDGGNDGDEVDSEGGESVGDAGSGRGADGADGADAGGDRGDSRSG
jgi:sugar-specific transcriptional regulator TrmB